MKKLNFLWLFLVINPAYSLSAGAIIERASDDPKDRFVRVENMILVSADARAGRDIAATVGEFVIVRKQEGAQTSDAQGLNIEGQTMLVIRDEIAGDYGVSDGTFFVLFREADSLNALVREHGLLIEDLFANAKMARVSVEDGHDVFVVMRQVRQDPRVRGVELNTTFDRLTPY